MGNLGLDLRVDMFARTEPIASLRDGAVPKSQPAGLAAAPRPHRTSSDALASTVPFALVDPDNPAATLVGMELPADQRRPYLAVGAVALVAVVSIVGYFVAF